MIERARLANSRSRCALGADLFKLLRRERGSFVAFVAVVAFGFPLIGQLVDVLNVVRDLSVAGRLSVVPCGDCVEPSYQAVQRSGDRIG